MGKSRSKHETTTEPAPRSEAAEQPESTRSTRTRKEKVLQARIPEDLDREIKRRAGRLGTSVSTVVRNVLINTFDLVEDIVSDSTDLALSITGNEADPAARTTARARGGSSQGRIVGWQEVALEINAVCSRCNEILARGTPAAIAVRERPGAPGERTILCKACLAKHLDGAADTAAAEN